MDYADFFPVVMTQARELADAGRASDLGAPVPSCPEWDVAKLVRHTGTAHRWSAGVVRTREPLSPKSIDLALPDDPAALPDWLEQSASELVATLADADPDGECWTWTADHHVRFWARRMAHETAVHRWDGQGAVGTAEGFDPELAVDGIDEHLENLPFVVGPEQARGEGETLHLHCTDVDGEWVLRLGPDGLEVRREHAKGDIALKGTASDLFLVVLGRVRPTNVEIFGDASALQRWEPVLHF
ncbi:MAG: maleylpyruvate isomerase family mycothiol-dependent enzyme [Acidimicrobiia bacterium]